MIEIVGTHDGARCCSCFKQTETKSIMFSLDGRQGISIVLCDHCRRRLVKLITENEDK